MGRKAMSLAVCLVAGATLGVGAPASAAERCAGTERTVYLCVDPTGGNPIRDCVYLGEPPCTEVVVPTPSITYECGAFVPMSC